MIAYSSLAALLKAVFLVTAITKIKHSYGGDMRDTLLSIANSRNGYLQVQLNLKPVVITTAA